MAEREDQSLKNKSDDEHEKSKIHVIHEKIPSEFIPKIGMEFESEDAAYNFYNSYAYRVGFSIRKGRSHKGIAGQIADRLLCCSCEGHRVKDKRDVYVKNHRAQTRFGCLASMKISNRITGKFSVTEFIAEHNHQTSTPSKSHLHRSQRKITPSQAAEVDLAESCGITPKATCDLMAKRAGGRENLGFIPDDYRNYLHSKRTIQMRTGDTGGMLECLQRMQLEDPNFFYAIQVDEDDLITNIFWADSKMMVDYSYFGDVVCFDTTYRKNKEGRPFAMFVGVNHHKLRFREFSKDFSKCIYEYEEEEEFIEAWDTMLDKYGLKGNSWLEQTFGLKEKWALVYGRDNFCADMTTTQRSESMNSLIKKYVSYQHNLLRFFDHFQRLVQDRRYEENKADFKATQRSLTLSFDVEILRHASTIYTPAVFKMIQYEVSVAYDCSMHIFFEAENVIEYKVIPHNKIFQHTVKYDSNSGVVTCSCKKFEFSGILCAHALKVLSSRNVVKIPEMYILKRWTKHAKNGSDRAICHNVMQEDPKAKMASWYTDLCRLRADLATKGAQNEEVYKIGVNGLIKTMEAMDACLKGSGKGTSTHETSIINVEDVCENNNKTVKGIKIKEKSRGSSKRLKGILERRGKKKKIVQEKEPSLQNLNSGLPSFQSTQAQLTGTRHNSIDVMGSQGKDQQGHS